MKDTSHRSNPDPWNDSLDGEYLWSNVNFGEAVTEVMTPLSWTVLKLIFDQWVLHPGHGTAGNIGGRPYLNISLFVSVLQALGRSRQDVLELLEGTLYMHLPDGIEIPLLPMPKRSLPSILWAVVRTRLRERGGAKGLPAYLATNAVRCSQLRCRIREAADKKELLALWQGRICPHVTGSVWHVMGSASSSAAHTMGLRRALEDLVGPDDAQVLISTLSKGSGSSNGSGASDSSGLLASLGPVVGIARLARGEMDRDDYLERFGHRGPHEFELSYPRPAEDPDWLDRELARFRENPVDVDGQLEGQRADFGAAWARFQTRYPDQADTMRKRIDKAAGWARRREAVRSEYVRDRWLVRTFALRAGELTGLGDDVFFLTLDELLDLLSGDATAVASIPAQRETYERYRALPSYPSIIVGRFDPFQWAANPNRQPDLFDARAPGRKQEPQPGSANLISGSPGSSGRVEGLVRRLDHPENGDQFQAGEVLVAKQTDIAWTLLFPRAAAVVTDVGAPLSHAAIVARELGIPAVVGCGDATMRLKTGDRVRVDGGRGTIEILREE
ncbi:MAG: PEP-utilizing enzyme [Anaerolineae bacterium]|jgi:pyruvate,water dikinase